MNQGLPNMVYALRGRVAVFVTGTGAIRDDEWKRYCTEAGTAAAACGEKLRIVVRTLGAGPNAAQRAFAAEAGIGSDRVRSAVVSESLIPRGIVKALSWLGLDVASFSVSQMAKAFDFLALTAEERTWATAMVEDGLARIRGGEPTTVPAAE